MSHRSLVVLGAAPMPVDRIWWQHLLIIVGLCIILAVLAIIQGCDPTPTGSSGNTVQIMAVRGSGGLIIQTPLGILDIEHTEYVGPNGEPHCSIVQHIRINGISYGAGYVSHLSDAECVRVVRPFRLGESLDDWTPAAAIASPVGPVVGATSDATAEAGDSSPGDTVDAEVVDLPPLGD